MSSNLRGSISSTPGDQRSQADEGFSLVEDLDDLGHNVNHYNDHLSHVPASSNKDRIGPPMLISHTCSVLMHLNRSVF